MNCKWLFVADGEETIALKSERYDDACREVLRIKKAKVYERTINKTKQWRFEIDGFGLSLPLSTDIELEAIEEGISDYLYGEVIESEN